MIYECLEKIKDKKGKIVEYIFYNEYGKELKKSTEEVVGDLQNNNNEYVNLQLNKAGKIIDKPINKDGKFNAEIQDLIKMATESSCSLRSSINIRGSKISDWQRICLSDIPNSIRNLKEKGYSMNLINELFNLAAKDKKLALLVLVCDNSIADYMGDWVSSRKFLTANYDEAKAFFEKEIREYSNIYDEDGIKIIPEVLLSGEIKLVGNSLAEEFFDRYIAEKIKEEKLHDKKMKIIQDMKAGLRRRVIEDPEYIMLLEKDSNKLKVVAEVLYKKGQDDKHKPVNEVVYGYIVENISDEEVIILYSYKNPCLVDCVLKPHEKTFFEFVEFIKFACVPEISFVFNNGMVKIVIELSGVIDDIALDYDKNKLFGCMRFIEKEEMKNTVKKIYLE